MADPRHSRFMTLVVELVGERFGVTQDQIFSHDRHRTIAIARQACYWLGRHASKPQLSYPQIARALGTDHTTVMHGVRRMAERLEDDAWLRTTLRELQTDLGIKAPTRLGMDGRLPVSEFDVSDALEVACG